jgi:hypothetical protein
MTTDEYHKKSSSFSSKTSEEKENSHLMPRSFCGQSARLVNKRVRVQSQPINIHGICHHIVQKTIIVVPTTGIKGPLIPTRVVKIGSIGTITITYGIIVASTSTHTN